MTDLLKRLRPLLHFTAPITGTPMVPLHHNTLREIIAALEAQEAEIERLREDAERMRIACINLLYAWDNKTPLAWQPDKHREILEALRAAIDAARKP